MEQKSQSFSKLVFCIVTLAFACAVSAYAKNDSQYVNGVKVVHLDANKTLKKYISGEDKKSLTSLKIVSPDQRLTEKDFKTLQEMKSLKEIDLSECKLDFPFITNIEPLAGISSIKFNVANIASYNRSSSNSGNFGQLKGESEFYEYIIKFIDRFLTDDKFTINHIWNTTQYKGGGGTTILSNAFPDIRTITLENVFPAINDYKGPNILEIIVDDISYTAILDVSKQNLVLYKYAEDVPEKQRKIVSAKNILKDNKPNNGVLKIPRDVFMVYFYTPQNPQSYPYVKELIIPKTLAYIGDGSFKGFSGLTEVTFEVGTNDLYIGGSAFQDSKKLKTQVFDRPIIFMSNNSDYVFPNLDSAIFNKPVVYFRSPCEANEIIFNDKCTMAPARFGDNTILKFMVVPEIWNGKIPICNTAYVPVGSGSKFSTETYTTKIVEFDPKSLNKDDGKQLIAKTIELKKPGTLLSVISPSDLKSVDSLTVVGFMNQDDIALLTKNGLGISYLDLSGCIIEEGDVKNLMCDNIVLQEAKLPKTMTRLDGVFKNCRKLKKVTLPPYLRSMWSDCFMNCTALEEIVFPASFNFLDKSNNFKGCTSLKRIIFNGSTVGYGRSMFGESSRSIKELRLPSSDSGRWGIGLSNGSSNKVHGAKVYVSKNVGCSGGYFSNCEIYFQSETPPSDNLYLTNCTIYCPQGKNHSLLQCFWGKPQVCRERLSTS